MEQCIGFETLNRCLAGSTQASRSCLGDERLILSAGRLATDKQRHKKNTSSGPTPSKDRRLSTPKQRGLRLIFINPTGQLLARYAGTFFPAIDPYDFPQLLRCPIRARVRCDGDAFQSAAAMLDDHEKVKHSASHTAMKKSHAGIALAWFFRKKTRAGRRWVAQLAISAWICGPYEAKHERRASPRVRWLSVGHPKSGFPATFFGSEHATLPVFSVGPIDTSNAK